MPSNERKDRTRRRGAAAKPRKTAPEVVYTPARPFNRSKLILRVLTVAAVAFAIFLGISIFFKVDTITVSGCEKYSEWTIVEKSGVKEGDSLLFFGEANAASKIIDALPYVKSVRFHITLPGKVQIIVEEVPVAYSIQSGDGTWWLITSEGRVAERVDAAKAGNYTTIVGITLKNPSVGADAVAEEKEPAGSAITGADRLDAAVLIMQQLEANEMLGVVASVDVSSLQSLQLWYGNRYLVKLGNSDRMDYKLAAVKSSVEQMSEYQTGILDASFTTFPDAVGYMQFQTEP